MAWGSCYSLTNSPKLHWRDLSNVFFSVLFFTEWKNIKCFSWSQCWKHPPAALPHWHYSPWNLLSRDDCFPNFVLIHTLHFCNLNSKPLANVCFEVYRLTGFKFFQGTFLYHWPPIDSKKVLLSCGWVYAPTEEVVLNSCSSKFVYWTLDLLCCLILNAALTKN